MKRFIFIITSALLLNSCASSVKLAKNWESEDFEKAKSKVILVAGKSPELKVRKAYEIAVVNQLKSKGIEAVAIHNAFPEITHNEERSQEEVDAILEKFKQKNISTLMLLSLQGKKTETKIVAAEKAEVLTPDLRGKYAFSFGVYDVNALPKLERFDNHNTTDEQEVVLKRITYILDAVTYDLSLPENKRLVSVNIVHITDPHSAKKVLNGFSKTVAKEF